MSYHDWRLWLAVVGGIRQLRSNSGLSKNVVCSAGLNRRTQDFLCVSSLWDQWTVYVGEGRWELIQWPDFWRQHGLFSIGELGITD